METFLQHPIKHSNSAALFTVKNIYVFLSYFFAFAFATHIFKDKHIFVERMFKQEATL